MESDKIYRDSYNYINHLLRCNCNNEIPIDYNKLDTETQGALRRAIDSVLQERRRAVGSLITKCIVP